MEKSNSPSTFASSLHVKKIRLPLMAFPPSSLNLFLSEYQDKVPAGQHLSHEWKQIQDP